MDSLDQEVLSRLARDMGGDSSVDRIIAMYIGKLPSEAESLHADLASGDLEQLGETAHRLKSSTAMLGATQLAVVLAEIEAAAKAGDAQAAGKWLGEFDPEKLRVERDMKARLPG